RLTAEDAAGLLERGEVSPADLHRAYLDAAAERNDELNVYLCTVEDGADGASGVPIAFKDLISTKGVETTAASKILTGYRPVFDRRTPPPRATAPSPSPRAWSRSDRSRSPSATARACTRSSPAATTATRRPSTCPSPSGYPKPRLSRGCASASRRSSTRPRGSSRALPSRSTARSTSLETSGRRSASAGCRAPSSTA